MKIFNNMDNNLTKIDEYIEKENIVFEPVYINDFWRLDLIA